MSSLAQIVSFTMSYTLNFLSFGALHRLKISFWDFPVINVETILDQRKVNITILESALFQCWFTFSQYCFEVVCMLGCDWLNMCYVYKRRRNILTDIISFILVYIEVSHSTQSLITLIHANQNHIMVINIIFEQLTIKYYMRTFKNTVLLLNVYIAYSSLKQLLNFLNLNKLVCIPTIRYVKTSLRNFTIHFSV